MYKLRTLLRMFTVTDLFTLHPLKLHLSHMTVNLDEIQLLPTFSVICTHASYSVINSDCMMA